MSVEVNKVAFWNAVRFGANCAEGWDLNELYLSDLQQTIACELFETHEQWNEVKVEFTEGSDHEKDFTVTCGRERARVEFGYTIISEEEV
jgi:hypothetical protein